ncbi:MFS transporter [Micromonospora sp. NPDC049679]|uniref:MFS transporter n=1 Tax=Micromonospora sp. NPDC049679 TaxID=3155920 RepID=UPI0033CCF6AB
MHSYRRDLQLLRDRRFALLFAARTVSVLGAAFAPVALAFGVLGLEDATAATLSVVLAAQAIPEIVFMLVGGVLADRFPRYRVMVAGEVLSTLAYGLLAAMLISGTAPVPALAAGAAVAGIGLAVFFPALIGIVPEVVADERLQAANGLLRVGTNIARIAGYALAGATVVLVGGGVALAVSAGLFAVSALLIAALRLPAVAARAAGPGRTAIADLRDGWREFVARQWLWVIVLQFAFIVAALQAAHGVLGPLVAKQELGGAGAWSAVLAGEAVGMLLGVAIAIRIRPTRPMLVCVLMTLPTAAPYLLLGVSAPLWMVVCGAAVMGICFDIFGVLWETTLQREIPPAVLSRVSSYDALGSFMFGPIGLLLAGPAALAFGARPSLIVCGGVIVVATLATLCSPSVRGMRVPAAEPAAHGLAVPTVANAVATPALAADGPAAAPDVARQPTGVVPS